MRGVYLGHKAEAGRRATVKEGVRRSILNEGGKRGGVDAIL